MFRVKICGVTTAQDAAAAVAAGADAIGINFFPGSPRCVSSAQASEVAKAAQGALRVGVFVNASASMIVAAAEEVGLDAVQLHGDEPPAAAIELAALLPEGVALLHAFRLPTGDLSAVASYAAAVAGGGRPLAAVLVDAYSPAAYGGTGARADWRALSGWRERLPGQRLVLAGGLTPKNVAEAIGQVRPDGVDVASGVESSPGVKDQAKSRLFVDQARKAFDHV
ncbi:N-(5'-phosphoribosyl)anthranilate isomerase [Pirellulimonas nuda]|uniref:N-(5'-phosphoribosyl)anthranilate isomerase n=1 Tax=Pirellulimonas nuda TaxID=2528009 RepID=A0A518DI33_9BACT|nr:phosphoribosylanthranilate isomerase [Pirellulimonas nuda]QDU91143.1 N-(5'-phosphoribosyl)anthranilate isomerase [Pirellulimonas nuda]